MDGLQERELARVVETNAAALDSRAADAGRAIVALGAGPSSAGPSGGSGDGRLGASPASSDLSIGRPCSELVRRLGAKGAQLDAIRRAGGLTPPGFVLTSDAVAAIRSGAEPPLAALRHALAALEQETGRRFGDLAAPLLLSVRLSPASPVADVAPAILGVGAPLDASPHLLDPSALTVERAFWRSLARAFGVAGAKSSAVKSSGLTAPGARSGAAADLEELVEDAVDAALEVELDDAATTAAIRAAAARAGFDALDAMTQLHLSIDALSAAWDAPRALRRRATVAAEGDCAVIVQALAPDLRGETCGAGWLRLYRASDGAVEIAGRFKPRSLGEERSRNAPPERELTGADIEDPMVANAVMAAQTTEFALGGPHEIAFAAGVGGAHEVAVLSAYPQRISAQAAIRIAVEHAESGRITRADAVRRIPARSLEQLLHESIDPNAPRDLIARGIAASPGAAAGRLAFTAEEAERMAQAGEKPILARIETAPEDIQAMHAAAAVVTTRGGLTSHAAVVARGLGTPCVVGLAEAQLDLDALTLTAPDGRVFGAGDWVTIDGSAGEALAGAAPTQQPELTGAFAQVMEWADGFRRLRVRANADTPGDAETARRLGVDGIGLCRTEQMFFEPDRIIVMREMILADDERQRRAALDRLLPMQRADFVQLFKIMGATAAQAAEANDAPPVNIRLLDPPLHEFLPQTEDGLARLAEAMQLPVETIARRANDLKEFNPMLGKRGCRMGVAFPEIYEMQARAIFEAALEVEAADGRSQKPEIMIPLVSAVREFELVRERIDAVAAAVRLERGASFDYSVGIMVETPRAALRAEPLGRLSSFFSFGTNDLTQMTYGLSRDDAGRLMRDYVERGVFEADPFQSLDQDGVGELIEMAILRGRGANPELGVGLCGEHGGDPATVAFCEAAGFDYVSCSPYRAPIARLAAAQAALARAARETGAGAW